MTNKLDELKDQAIDVLQKYLSEENPTDMDAKKAKTAQSIFASWVKIEQTKSSREATAFFVARELAADKQQLRRFLDASAPHLTKELPKEEDERKSLTTN